MKIIVLATVALLVAGCQDKAQIQQLQARVATLESNSGSLDATVQSVAEADASMSNQWAAFAVTNNKHMDALWDRTTTNFIFTMNALRFIQDAQDRLTNLEAISNHIPKVVSYGRPQPAQQFTPPPAQTYIQGVPTEIYTAIRAGAESKWPGNYEMQVFSIKEQTEAYLKLHPQ
jgi:outer membrane murein-binding lipoprotein Lpp